MRYSVRYECADKKWVVTDSANDNKVLAVDMSKTEAYRYAKEKENRLQNHDPIARGLFNIRKMMPQTLVVG